MKTLNLSEGRGSRRAIALASLLLAAGCLLGTATTRAATVAYYKFDNGMAGEAAIGAGTILDSSGNGLDGTPFRKPKYVPSTNPDSTLALNFDGTFARVFVPDNPLLRLTHSLTLEAYVYLRSQDGNGVVVIRGDSRYDFDPYYLVVNEDGVLFFQVESAPHVVSQVSTTLPVHQWVHVAGTLDDATGMQALYVNGSLVDSTVTTIRPEKLKALPHTGLGIGGNVGQSPDTALFHGLIDEVRISDVALDPSQFLPPR
jgi:hypothetical protein